MCRFFAYRGEPAALSRWLYECEHSLERQACAPRELLRGTVNVDGTGIAWWTEESGEPLRYRSERPPWSNPNLPHLAPRIRSGVQLAAVRSATPGIAFGPEHVQPFVHHLDSGQALAGAHNGWLGGFRGPLGRRVLDALSPEGRSELAVLNDSATAVLLVTERIRGGLTCLEAVAQSLAAVAAACRTEDQAATLNLAIATARETVVARYSFATAQNSLYLSSRDTGCLVASEPLDAGPWQPVPRSHLIRLAGGEAQLVALAELCALPADPVGERSSPSSSALES